MKLKLALLLIAAFSFGVAAQTVTITPKKVTYKRSKPREDFKKTFTITYPKVRAANSQVSQKIERAISYQSVLDLRLNVELRTSEWLETADYDVKYNKNGILCIQLSMDGSAAYPDGTIKVVCVDTGIGVRARPADVFTNIAGLTSMVRKAQEKEKRDAIPRIKKDEPDIEQPELLFGDRHFTQKDIDGYEISDKGVIFHYDYEFIHATRALEPDGAFFFAWSQLRPYIKRGGLLTRVAR